MIITKEGVVVKRYQYEAKCDDCGCEFRFNGWDDNVVETELEDGDMYDARYRAVVICPQEGCGNTVIWHRK